MSSKLFMIQTGNTSGSLTTPAGKIATGTGLRCLLQIAPTVGIEIVEWGVSFDGSAAATPGQVDLVEVDVAASGGTAANVPAGYLTSSVTGASQASLVYTTNNSPNALQTTNATFQVGVVNFGGYGQAQTGNPMEQMNVTSGGSTTTLVVTRGANDTPAVTSFPVGSLVYALPGTGVYSDIQPYSSQPAADPTYALCANVGTALTGFSFATYNTPTRVRQGDFQLLPPTAPYVKQFPLERGFEINPGRFGQIRCQFGTTVNAWAYAIFQA